MHNQERFHNTVAQRVSSKKCVCVPTVCWWCKKRLPSRAPWPVSCTHHRHHTTPVGIHWLPQSTRGAARSSLQGTARSTSVTWSTGSDPPSKCLLMVTKSHTRVYADRPFKTAATTLWNNLSDELKSIEGLHVFKKQLKTHLFRIAYCDKLWFLNCDWTVIVMIELVKTCTFQIKMCNESASHF